MVSLILQDSKKDHEQRRTRGQRHNNTKRNAKRYAYARFQELYKKKPGVLAKYIREGISWLDYRSATLSRDNSNLLHQFVGHKSSHRNIFDHTVAAEHHIHDEVTGAITKEQLNHRNNRLKKGSAPDLKAFRRSTLNTPM